MGQMYTYKCTWNKFNYNYSPLSVSRPRLVRIFVISRHFVMSRFSLFFILYKIRFLSRFFISIFSLSRCKINVQIKKFHWFYNVYLDLKIRGWEPTKTRDLTDHILLSLCLIIVENLPRCRICDILCAIVSAFPSLYVLIIKKIKIKLGNLVVFESKVPGVKPEGSEFNLEIYFSGHGRIKESLS